MTELELFNIIMTKLFHCQHDFILIEHFFSFCKHKHVHTVFDDKCALLFACTSSHTT